MSPTEEASGEQGAGSSCLDTAHKEGSEMSSSGVHVWRWRVTVTVVMTLSHIALGLFSEIAGPTLPYLKDRIGVDYEEISRVLVARSVGYFIGSILGGLLCDEWPRLVYLYFSASFLMAAVGTGAAPRCGSLVLLSLMFLLQGVGQGCICTGLSAVVMRMWRNKTTAPLISQHFCFGVGALLAPQLANPFIKVIRVDAILTTVSSIIPSQISNISRVPEVMVEEHIEYPYTIIASISAVFSAAFFLIFLTDHLNGSLKGSLVPHPTQRNKSISQVIKLLSPNSCSGGDTLFGCIFSLFITLAFLHFVGGERAISRFIYSFSIEASPPFTPTEASLLNSAFWMSYIIGRGVSTLAAIRCPVNILFLIAVVFNIINGVVLAAWGTTNSTILWLFTCSYGFFLSPLFPTALVWAFQYVEMTGVGVAIAYKGSAVGAMLYQWLTGYLFQYYGRVTLMYVLLGCSLNIGLLYVVLQVLGSRHGNRFRKGDPQDREDKEEEVI